MRLLTVAQVQARLGDKAKSVKTAYKFVRHNKLARTIPGVRGIVVYEHELDRILEDLPCPQSKIAKANGSLRVPNGESAFIAFCERGKRKARPSRLSGGSEVTFLTRRS